MTELLRAHPNAFRSVLRRFGRAVPLDVARKHMHSHVYAVARNKVNGILKEFELRMALVITQHTQSVAQEMGMDQADVKVLFGQGDAKFGNMR